MDFDLLIIAYGLIVGLSLGLTGSGGSILAIPLLVYGLGLPVSNAIVISLLMVASIALFGAVRQSFSGNVNWKSAVLFSISGVLISPIVVHLTHDVNETLRLVLFAFVMLFVSYRMAFGTKQKPLATEIVSTQSEPQPHKLNNTIKTAAGGALAGTLSGFFGVGGGFVIVPLLTMIFKMPYRIAVGTSLASIFMISLAAISGFFLTDVHIDWSLFLNFVLGGILGIIIGSALVNKISNHIAKIIFAIVTASLAIFMLIDKLYIHQGGL